MRKKSNWRILVEARKDVAHVDSLNAIAEAINAAGHHVVRGAVPSQGACRTAVSSGIATSPFCVMPRRPATAPYSRISLDVA